MSFLTNPLLGANLDSASTTAEMGLRTTGFDNAGLKRIYVVAGATLSTSTTYIAIASAGTATSTSAGAADFQVGLTGGVASGSYWWAKAKALSV